MTMIKEWQECREEFSDFIAGYFSTKSNLVESMLYTLRQGKKFRPFLSYATAKALGLPSGKVVAYAAAIEMIHAFSLIHDDLPALDNDDFRRGEKTNHKVFGEAVAILSGDALLNEAFACVIKNYGDRPSMAIELVKHMTDAVGINGMIEGQVQDIKAQNVAVDYPSLKRMHELKTGALIKASVLGAASICTADIDTTKNLQVYAEALGLAFQIADDLIEVTEGKEELGSYVGILGLDEAKRQLDITSKSALDAISKFDNADLLKHLVIENQNRKF